MQRLFIHSSQKQDSQVRLSEDDTRHLQVVKTKPQELIEFIVTDIGLYLRGRVIAFKKNRLDVEVLESRPVLESNRPELTLIQCLPKPDKFAEILKACTEMGASQFIPALSQRVISQPQKKEMPKLERWQAIISNAANQSRQEKLPDISPIQPLETILNTFDLALLFWEEETRPIQSVLRPFFQTKNTAMHALKIGCVIGPEGGLCPEEAAHLIEKGFTSVSLGSTILRVEHAGLVACSTVLYESGFLTCKEF